MHRRIITIGALASLAVAGTVLAVRGAGAPAPDRAAVGEGEEVVVYKSPTCGCCSAWVTHLREAGYDVDAVDVAAPEELARRKAELGVPNDLGSCHTARVAGYTVEGHVPASVVARLLRERPGDVVGIAVPGMPIGSPGMEGPNPRPYDVIAFRADGSRVVYESVYPGRASSDAR